MATTSPTLIGIPWDVNSSFMRGAAAAPPLIRQALFSPASNPKFRFVLTTSLVSAEG
jgi:arginase family enzyme